MEETMATTTNPRARRATSGTKTAAPKTAAPKATAPKAAAPTPPVTEDGTTRVKLELVKGNDTRSYSVFTPPADSGCVGKFYAPLGTETVMVLLIGPADVAE